MEGRNMDKLKYKARAKVNLGLDVCGRLPNGYHKVKMIRQLICMMSWNSTNVKIRILFYP